MNKYETKLKSVLNECGYIEAIKIGNTLQGSIWRAFRKSTYKQVVVKIANKKLHQESMGIVRGEKVCVHENIAAEKRCLKYLNDDKYAPQSMVKYHQFLKSKNNYYLIMEDGGISLFDFIVKIHTFINAGMLDISEW
eukprot:273994_1